MNLKKELENIKNLKIKTRGHEVKNNFECVEILEGKKGRKEVEDKLDELGILPNYKEYNAFEWYPIKEDVATIICAQKLFDWSEEDLKKFGECSFKTSFTQKIVMKIFVSPEKAIRKIPEQWSRYFDKGEVEVKEFDKDKKLARFHIKNFNIYPSYCLILLGYFKAGLSLTISSDKIEAKETKCTFKDDKVHEFLISYE